MKPYVLDIQNLTDIEHKFVLDQSDSDVFTVRKTGNPFQNFKFFQIQCKEKLINDTNLLMKINGKIFPLFSFLRPTQNEPNLLNVDLEIDTNVDHEFYINPIGTLRIVFVPENCDKQCLKQYLRNVTYNG